jgi:ankyrin repeat protein
MDDYYTYGYCFERITSYDLEEINKYNKVSIQKNNMSTFIQLISKGKIDEVKENLEADKAYVSLADSDSETLLFYSVFIGNYDITRLILKFGADPNHKDSDGQTAIYRAIFINDEKIIGLLHEYNANLNSIDKDGNTVLHIAILSKNYPIIKSLLEYGSDPKIRNNDGMSSFDYSSSKLNSGYVIDKKISKLLNRYKKN